MSTTSVVLAALTTYLVLDRNHAEELGGGTRITLDFLLGGKNVPLVLMLALLGMTVALSLRGRPAPVRSGARRR